MGQTQLAPKRIRGWKAKKIVFFFRNGALDFMVKG